MNRALTLLTTDTLHHRYFAREMSRAGLLSGVVLETSAAKPPFETFHPFEARRDEYEREVLLGGESAEFAEFAPVRRAADINDAEVLAHLQRGAPAFVVVFGTRKLAQQIIGCARVACLNLHGGDPRQYRGLDTHLWAIYHGDFAGVVTCLHHVDLGLDTGDIVDCKPIPIAPGMELHELRAANTRVCVELVKSALSSETPNSVRQAAKGRYYSFMPGCLKDVCVGKFHRYAGSL
jgi:methionyl-tRNA formyltransferase